MTVGQYLKQERELRGITIDHVASITKISPHILVFIENDQFDKLPSKIFAKGFIKSYAKSIGINPDEAALRYDEAHSVRTGVPAYHQQVYKAEKAVKEVEKPVKQKKAFNLTSKINKIHVSGRVVFAIIAASVVAAAYFASR